VKYSASLDIGSGYSMIFRLFSFQLPLREIRIMISEKNRNGEQIAERVINSQFRRTKSEPESIGL
jgi:hypothetical protein